MDEEQKWPNKLYLVRHGESILNFQKEWYEKFNTDKLRVDINKRDIDIELTEEGKRQAATVGKELNRRKEKIDVVFISPAVRCRQTAESILDELHYKPKIIVDERLREKEWGAIHGLTKKGIQTLFPEEFRRMELEGNYYYRPIGGESYPDVGLRVHSFLGALVRSYPKSNVLVVSHSVVIKMFRKVLEKLEEKDILLFEKADRLKNASLSSFVYNPQIKKLKLTEWNKTFY